MPRSWSAWRLRSRVINDRGRTTATVTAATFTDNGAVESDCNQRPRLSQWVSPCSPREDFGAYHSAIEAFKAANNVHLAFLDSEDIKPALLAHKQYILSSSSRLISRHGECIEATEVASFPWRKTVARGIVKAKIEIGQAVEVRLRLVGQRWVWHEVLLRRWVDALM
jgi:hypothetical protein